MFSVTQWLNQNQIFTTDSTVPMAIGITDKITDFIILDNPCITRVLSDSVVKPEPDIYHGFHGFHR